MLKRSSIAKFVRSGMNRYKANMRSRLLAFLLLLIFTMITGVMFLLSIFGIFPFGEAEQVFSRELDSLSGAVTTQYGGASVQAVRLSERISETIAETLLRDGISPSDLDKRPEMLETVLSEQIPLLLSNLDATDCSGVFVTLDATVNPDIPGAQNSKAGLYIRNIEPSAGGAGPEAKLYLRGPASFVSGKTLNMQAEWDLEFNIANQPFWLRPIEAYNADPAQALSRLVYWCAESPVPGLNEPVMVCSVPVLDAYGGVLGVCGFEISEMNFTLRHRPDDSEFYNIIFLFSSLSSGGIRLEDALFAGNITVYGALPDEGYIRNMDSQDGLFVFGMSGEAALVGMEKMIRLYPDDSPYAQQMFVASVLLPKSNYDAAQSIMRWRFALILFVLMGLGIAASVLISRRYMKPITDKLNETNTGDLPEKTNITEIDLLLDRFRVKGSPIPENLFDDFIANVRRLTPTEMVVFHAHAEGKSLDETAKSMFISVNTLKKHNTHIYEKLSVSNQEELRLYISLLKRCGMMDKVFSGKA